MAKTSFFDIAPQCPFMLISVKMTQPISIFFHRKLRYRYLGHGVCRWVDGCAGCGVVYVCMWGCTCKITCDRFNSTGVQDYIFSLKYNHFIFFSKATFGLVLWQNSKWPPRYHFCGPNDEYCNLKGTKYLQKKRHVWSSMFSAT